MYLTLKYFTTFLTMAFSIAILAFIFRKMLAKDYSSIFTFIVMEITYIASIYFMWV